MYKTIYTEVEVDLAEFDTEDLVKELESRGHEYNTENINVEEMREVLKRIWLNRRMNRDYQYELDQLIYGVLGKVV